MRTPDYRGRGPESHGSMPKSIKIVLGVLLGFVVWFGAATVGNLVFPNLGAPDPQDVYCYVHIM